MNPKISIKHKAKLRDGYTAYFEWSENGMEVQWSPDEPPAHYRSKNRKFIKGYLASRTVFLQKVANQVGGNVAVVDPGSTKPIGIEMVTLQKRQ
jgi:hypothetical protein